MHSDTNYSHKQKQSSKTANPCSCFTVMAKRQVSIANVYIDRNCAQEFVNCVTFFFCLLAPISQVKLNPLVMSIKVLKAKKDTFH